jgi:benzoyl-CoA reductase/2-hydroxyglutaryl-CoA dehydratase subunit BcrC/BadD/HgdB
LPRPDLLVACSNICGTVVKWYEVLAERLNVPLVVIDTPFLHDGDSGGMAPALTAYVRGQIEELVETLERLTGRELREQRLLEVAERSLGAVRLWKQILGRCASRPSPMTCFDAFIHMAPIVTLRGTESGLRYYRLLDRELERRQQRGEGALAGERFRLLWDNLPIWPAMRFLGETFAGHGACLVADTYTSAWAEARLVPERSLDTLAEAYTSVYLNLGLGDRIARIRGLAERFQADGLVIHSNRSCKPYSFGQYDLARALSEDGRLPCLVLEADMVDPRALSEGAVRSRIEAFVEMLAERQLGQRPASAART